jgi:AraC family transcriptional regulator
MAFEMISKPQFDAVGYQMETTRRDERHLKEIPQFWLSYIRGDWAIPLYDLGSCSEYGISIDYDKETGVFHYFIGVEVEADIPLPPGTIRHTFPAATYAVFTTPKVPREQLTQAVQETWRAIQQEELTHSGYEHSGGVDFEYYDEKKSTGDEFDLVQMDIYIPVIAKASRTLS